MYKGKKSRYEKNVKRTTSELQMYRIQCFSLTNVCLEYCDSYGTPNASHVRPLGRRDRKYDADASDQPLIAGNYVKIAARPKGQYHAFVRCFAPTTIAVAYWPEYVFRQF